MTPYRLNQLTFSDGNTVEVPPKSIVVLVGANNSGKSRALRDIAENIQAVNPADVAVVVDVAAEKLVDADGLWSWLEERAHVFHRGGQEFVTRPNANELVRERLRNLWGEASALQELAPFLSLIGNTEQRLNLAATVQSFDPTEGHPSNALHELFVNSNLEEKLADATERAFRRRVTVNRAAGQQVHLHLGSVKHIPEPRDVRNTQYVEALRNLKKVHEEGDGIRSYIGILLSVIAAEYPIVLLDEPEAFLHPPQAQQLARELARLSPEGESQLIVATHSADFLQGVLDGDAATVTVVRLDRRDDDVNEIAVLQPEALKKLWGDPLLRYSSLLDGLFHRGVVLCEADSDCRFYQATLDATLARENQPAHDLLFTHTGGKDRLPVAISAMRAIGVNVQVVADLDVLAVGKKMKEIVEALDGDWTSFERDHQMVVLAVAQLGTAPKIRDVKERVGQELERLDGTVLTSEQARRIEGTVKVQSGWKHVKRGGIASLPRGQAFEAAERLLTAVREIGLHIVPVGETECWDKSIGGHGPAWVSEALEKYVHIRPGPHAEFIQAILT